jgi:hypothetical protein
VAKSETVYCTYFDKGFLLKGLTFHSSLLKYDPSAKLWILAFDKYTEKILKKMKLKGVTVVTLEDFEDKELLTVKPTRHPVEYYWTCTPSWILYVMGKNQSVKYVVYLDADLYFFSDPNKGVAEIGDKSLLVVEHRFSRERVGMATNGRFNVAFNVFRNDQISRTCLKRWRKQCLDWCYSKPEGGKLGDQTYLDEWPVLYRKNLVISKNLGVDTAPWNISQYKVTDKDGRVFINNDQLICYHFHQFQVLSSSKFSRVHGYNLSGKIVDNIYKPYEMEINKQYKKLKTIDPHFEIKFPSQFNSQILRQKLAKYLGPVYWKIKGLVYTLR